jgi:CO/xanthine dehydrogenase Mo-binding subunit
MTMPMNRRDFIRTAAVATGGLTLSLRAVGRDIVLAQAAGITPIGDFIRITPEGDVLFQVIKHEMGQGVATSLAQILCEELCADWNRLRVEFPMADMQRYQNDRNGGHDTGGSCTIIYQYDLLRKAGATARQLLVNAAALGWEVSPNECIAENHSIIHRRSSRQVGFGAVATRAATLPVPAEVALKDAKAFRLIGTPQAAKLIPEIVTGQVKYGIDTQVPGMLYAVVARCPVFKGTLKSYDASEALKVKGVRKVFTTQPIAGPQFPRYMPNDIRAGVVVVANSFWAAQTARAALKIEWDGGANGRLSSEDFARLVAERAIQKSDPTGFVGDENAVADLKHVRKTLRASYVYPHQMHSCMEPLNCTAHVTNDSCEIWMGSQAPNLIVSELHKVLKIPEERIKVHLMPSGGGFGRRYYPDVAVEAAFISREAGNVPVKTLWTREDDQLCNFANHYQHMEYQAALDDQSKLYAWYEKELRTYTWGSRYADPSLPSMAYDIPNIRYDFEDLSGRELVQSSAWRGVVMHGKALSECFIDEIAAQLERDPYEFRLSLLTPGRDVFIGSDTLSSDRMRRVLMLAAQKGGWGRKLEPGRGMGIALIPYGNTCCAAVAEVTVRDKQVIVDRVTAAIDCGRVINPSGAAGQITGGMVWGLTALFNGGVPIANGRALQSNFHENKLLRMNECPQMDVHFVDSQAERPWGIGEVSTPLVAPAVLNAIHAATGKRIRTLPISLQEL